MITLDDDTLRCDDDAFFWQKDARIISLEVSLALPLSSTSTPLDNHILIGFEDNLSTIVDIKHGDRRQFCRYAACFGHR